MGERRLEGRMEGISEVVGGRETESEKSEDAKREELKVEGRMKGKQKS